MNQTKHLFWQIQYMAELIIYPQTRQSIYSRRDSIARVRVECMKFLYVESSRAPDTHTRISQLSVSVVPIRTCTG